MLPTDYHRAEEARRESEEKYRKLFDEALDGIALADAETGIILDCNQALLDLVGRTREEVIGQPQRILHPPEAGAGAFSPTFARHRAGASGQVLEAQVITKTGEIKVVEIKSNLIELGGRPCLRGVFHDITERKRAETALAWEAAVNAAMAELGQALISPATLEEISVLVLAQARRLTGSAYGFIGYIDQKTGHLVCPTMTRDVWDICEVEGKGAVFHIFTGLWGWVLKNRQSLLTNRPQGDPRSSGLPPGHLSIDRFCCAPAMLGDQLAGQVALANPGRDYMERDMVLVERLAQLYALAIQRQQAEDALRERTAELQARNEDLDAFAHTVAHDLKTPLTSILGFSEILETYPALPEEQRHEYLHAVAQHGRTMDNIVRELLLLASVRKEDVRVGPLDMARIAGEVQHRLKDAIEQAHGTIVAPTEWPKAVGYSPWIEEVWINYISNALKYGGRPPRVTLGATKEAGGTVRFWVQDNGAGLTEEETAALFKPFTRLDQVRARGHGLGLSIVRRIVEKLGGQVGVECQEGQGCTFWFTLPGGS